MPPNDTMWTWHPNDIKRVIIKREITKICEQAFYGLSYLESVSIPDSVTQIEAASFYACNSLGFVNIPSSVKYKVAQMYDNGIGTEIDKGSEILHKGC